ncbi:phosphoribosylformylglycinamidine synthase subunit PurL [bacterium]|nr:phosphoribosylformylglycinamidine synthase subunit PurL [bacterium]
MLWEIDIYPAAGQPDLVARSIASDAPDLGLPDFHLKHARGYLIEGGFSQDQVEEIASRLFADSIVEKTVIGQVGDRDFLANNGDSATLVHVLPKPGVTDAVAESASLAMTELGFPPEAVRTFNKYWISDLSDEEIDVLCEKLLANESIEEIRRGGLSMEQLGHGQAYDFVLQSVAIRNASDEQLKEINRAGQLSLNLVELQTIQQHYRELHRDPTDIELESIAQTWSEHCSHKTLAGRIDYTDENGTMIFDNMLKETIFQSTVDLQEEFGEANWCVSVFKDNAGIVQFDDRFNIAFKVETHNRPSAIEPYGGANTGIGGVIRDTLGTGMGAKPICNTDVFCFADPNTSADQVPDGVLHPRRVMKGVVSGVRDYGNRMGIPTVNGAIYFDDRYIGNPLVFCGNVGILPKDKSFKAPRPGDMIVTIGGRTGRDGIHGATFSSETLNTDSEKLSGGAVQIGNAITEKMVADVLLQARDLDLYTAVTDCGAGGFSSAVGEMGEEIGAEVWLEKAPLKYEGLTYTEIWISEAQERMVVSVPLDNVERLIALCESEGVHADVIGKFEPTGNLVLKYNGIQVGEVSMKFLHDGRPPVVRKATYQPAALQPLSKSSADFSIDLQKILSSLNVASKEWVIRQYDHEVQAGSVIKPLVGVANDGPSDAAVIRPRLDSRRGVVIACGMNPYFGDFDTYHMAASGIDEALRNCVAVGADPDRIAVLDNFCWGNTDRPEMLGSLTRAALACRDYAKAFKTPFISGKDSLKNEFVDTRNQNQRIAIPATLLISAMGQVNSVDHCVSMDLKESGSHLFQLGMTQNEMGGCHWSIVSGASGGQVPRVDAKAAKWLYGKLHQAIENQLVLACHDLSEGGLAVCLAEMSFAGGLGAEIQIDGIEIKGEQSLDEERVDLDLIRLFSESNSRFVCEVASEQVEAFVSLFDSGQVTEIGRVSSGKNLIIRSGDRELVSTAFDELKQAWQRPLDW